MAKDDDVKTLVEEDKKPAPVKDLPSVDDDLDTPDPEENLMEELMGQFVNDDEDEDAQTDESASAEEPKDKAAATSEEAEEDAEESEEETPEAEEESTKEVEEQQTTSKEEEASQEGPTPEELRANLDQYVNQAQELLAKQVYSMTDDDVAELEENPAEFFPKVAARLHMQVMQASVMNVARMLPMLMENINSAKTAATSHEEAFFQKWPSLQGKNEVVTRIGQVYRQMYPQATAEQFINDVGAQATVALGLNSKAPEEQAAPKAAPHKPAGASAAPRAAPRKDTNEFALLAEDDED